MMVDRPRSERLLAFFQLLATAPEVSSEGEALLQIAEALNSVEDEMTGIPRNPYRWQSDGRMYPPQADARREVPNHRQVARYRSRGHNTFIRSNGAIQICNVDGMVVFEKPGRDGRKVWDEDQS